MAGEAPRSVVPRVVAELAALRDGVERPHLAAGARVEGTDITRRVLLVREAIPDAVAEDHDVLVDDWRRCLRVVLPVDVPDEALGEVDLAVPAEGRDGLTGLRVQRDEAVARVEEDADVVPVPPCGDSAVDEALSARRLAVLVGFRVVAPQLAPGLGLESGHLVVGCAHIEHAVDHQRRVLERAGPRAVLLEGNLVGRPLPRHAETAHVGGRDLVQRRVVGGSGVGGVDRPATAGRVGSREPGTGREDSTERRGFSPGVKGSRCRRG